jgi:NAD(P)-dependent dehydrogenase (short-subunit alcohol dehydrogenase family)
MPESAERHVGLSGQTVLVTGAGRGLGRACSLAFAEARAHVIAVARSQPDLDSLAAEGRGNIEIWTDDVTQGSFYSRIERLERLDVLLCNAGMNRPQSIEDVTTESLDAMLQLNVRALFLTSQAAARVMLRAKRGGSIIHMSSQMGHVGAPRRSVYCMTKHAVEGLTKALAVELAPGGIRVNSVAPTFIETDMTRRMLEDAEFNRSVLESIPMGRLATPQDVVEAVLFLAARTAAMVTGHSLRVDGGWTAR